jgi:predicted nucleic acid-binding Zn ribbon protein
MARGRRDKVKKYEGVALHRHCYICGKPIELSEDFCGLQCEEEYNILKRRNRNKTLVMVGITAVLIVILLYFQFLV